MTTFRTLLAFSWHYVVENAAPNCSSAIEKQQQASFLLRSFWRPIWKGLLYFLTTKSFWPMEPGPQIKQQQTNIKSFWIFLVLSLQCAPNCSSAIEKQQQQAAFLLRSFGASNLKRAAFFFDYKEFLANGGTVGGLLCQQFISSILFVRHKLLMELFPNLRSTVLLLACWCTIGPTQLEKYFLKIFSRCTKLWAAS